jgi:heme-degrading monooxygenase HmoA
VEKVLIDVFEVPEAAVAEFLVAVRTTTPFLRSLPGYVEGYVFQKKGGPGRYNVVTTAVWANEEAYQAAKLAAQDEYHRIGFNPQEVIARLGVTIERAEYDRSPY